MCTVIDSYIYNVPNSGQLKEIRVIIIEIGDVISINLSPLSRSLVLSSLWFSTDLFFQLLKENADIIILKDTFKNDRCTVCIVELAEIRTII